MDPENRQVSQQAAQVKPPGRAGQAWWTGWTEWTGPAAQSGRHEASGQLPSIPSLEYLRKQAKDLRVACQADDADAIQRLQALFPKQSAPFKLTQAQLVLAREYGCASWAQLRGAVLKALVARLAVHHWSEWRAAAAARTAREQAGEQGLLAVLEGLSHPGPRVRRGAADYMDHHADDRCVEKLAELVEHDPVPYVRWSALHALKCQRCKPSPLTRDLTALLMRVAQEDSSPRVRARAVGSLPAPQLARVAREDPSPKVRLIALKALGGQQGSVLAQKALEEALGNTDEAVRRTAHSALRRQSPEYRERVAQGARQSNRARATRVVESATDPVGSKQDSGGDADD